MKSISQMYAEEVKSLPLTKYGRPDALATSRIKADLQVRFWLPIAEMLDPRDHNRVGGAAQDFYSRGQGALGPHEMQESLALMKHYLGVPSLTFSIWFQLRPIFRDLLSAALTKADLDLMVCAGREFIRLTLGQPVDSEYGLVDPSVADLDGPWYSHDTNDEEWFGHFAEYESDFPDWEILLATKAWRALFDDAEKFANEYRNKDVHRLNMKRALQPVLDFAPAKNLWFVDFDPYVKALLDIDFKEARLGSLTVHRTRPVETQPAASAATDRKVPCLEDV